MRLLVVRVGVSVCLVFCWGGLGIFDCRFPGFSTLVD